MIIESVIQYQLAMNLFVKFMSGVGIQQVMK